MHKIHFAVFVSALFAIPVAHAENLKPCKAKDEICLRLETMQKQIDVLVSTLNDVQRSAKEAADQSVTANKRRLFALVDLRSSAHREGNPEIDAGCQYNTPAGNHDCQYRANKICQSIFANPKAGHLVRGDDSQNMQHILCYLDP